MPVANTSAPPNTTCMAAETGGVSMYFHRIQLMTASSTITTRDRDGDRGPEIRDQVRQGVADAADRGHQAADRAAHERAPRPVRLPLSDSASAKPIEMPAPIEAARPTRKAFQTAGGEGGGEHRRQRRDRAVHQPGEPRLHTRSTKCAAAPRPPARARSAGRFSSTAARRCARACSSASARSPSSLRIEASEVRAAACR